MSFTKYVLASIWHYRKLNLTVVFGVALSTAILLGALIIGDSVQFSLQQVTFQRLGRTSLVITASERLFGKHLAESLSLKSGVATTPLLRSNGIGVVDGGKFQINQLAVWGVDSTFERFSGRAGLFVLNGNEAAINENLARISGLKVGDEMLLRLNKLNAFPANTPFVSAAESSVSFRVIIAKILKPGNLGNFNLQNNQSFPRNLFLNLDWMNEQMKLPRKANVVLVAEGITEQNLIISLQKTWMLEDLNLKIRENYALNYTELISDRVFIDPVIEQYCVAKVPGAHPVFSYFVNDFSFAGSHTPYSFVSTYDSLSGQQMIVSQWLADDLKLGLNDTVRMSYFQVGPLRKLFQKDTSFVTDHIYLLKGKFADPDLMPVIPGLSDAGNCRDWKTGVPVDLKKIRPQDETYWKLHKGTPKAFISTETAKKLWGNRFGQSTSIRLDGLKSAALEQSILSGLLPTEAGFDVKNALSEGLLAASTGVNFGQLFIGLSFFLLAAAFLLSYLLFKLFLRFRKEESVTLTSLGFSFKTQRNLFLAEACALVTLGILIGIPFGLMYDYLILKAINTIWFDIVRTSIAQIYIQPATVLWGALVVFFISIVTIYVVLNQFLKKKSVNSKYRKGGNQLISGFRSMVAGIILVLLSVIILIQNAFSGNQINPDLFYISGMGLLPGLLFLLDALLRRIGAIESYLNFSFKSFILKRLAGERKRNMLAVSFLSIGIFMVVSTGLNRKEMSLDANLASSGTGGYDYFVETTLPVLFDPNSPQGKSDLGLPEAAQTVPFHVQPGDDASCLNLNRISRPRIIACNPAQFSERSAFTFTSGTKDLDANHPWLSLGKPLADNVLPAFADQTVIQWGLGKKIGDTLIYRDEAGAALKLRLIGGLENSVFQGNIIIAEDFFVKAFPSVSGATMFLVQAPAVSFNVQEFQEGWRHYGSEIISTTDRLLNFNVIENTYLNIFLLLGALGLLIGTAGLGILIFRITFEQIPEYALLQSIGFMKSKIFSLLLTEKLFVILSAVLIGSISATMSALPLLISQQHSNLWIWLPSVALLVILTGFLSTIVAIRLALKNNLITSLSGE